MADGVTVTSGANSTVPNGTKIATDDAGAAGHVQIVKLAYSADGSATAIPADGSGITVQGTTTLSNYAVSSTSATVSVGDETSSTQVIASNANRKGWVLTNLSSAVCYVKMGTGASATSFHRRLAQYDSCGQDGMLGVYTGAIHAIWASDAGGTINGGDW